MKDWLIGMLWLAAASSPGPSLYVGNNNRPGYGRLRCPACSLPAVVPQ